jgi:hypothetical protein
MRIDRAGVPEVISRSIVAAPIALAFALSFGASFVACNQFASTDVSYRAEDGGDASADAAVDGDVIAQEAATGAPCPCDPTQGLGCCLPKAGATPYCAPNDGTCEGASGIFLGCTKGDPGTDSVCCWSSDPDGGATPNIAALASQCGARAQSCLADGDCTGGAKCHVSTCEGISLGVCGDGVAPVCPVAH